MAPLSRDGSSDHSYGTPRFRDGSGKLARLRGKGSSCGAPVVVPPAGPRSSFLLRDVSATAPTCSTPTSEERRASAFVELERRLTVCLDGVRTGKARAIWTRVQPDAPNRGDLRPAATSNGQMRTRDRRQHALTRHDGSSAQGREPSPAPPVSGHRPGTPTPSPTRRLRRLPPGCPQG